MSAEDEVRERVVAYLTDRHGFEVFAADLGRRDGHGERQDRELEDAYRTFQERHRTTKAKADMVYSGFSDPPEVDPARTRITSVTVKGSRATVTTLEDTNPGVDPFEWRYELRLEDGRWLLSDRRSWYEEERKWLRDL